MVLTEPREAARVIYSPHGIGEELLPEGGRLAPGYPGRSWNSKELNLAVRTEEPLGT